MIEYSVLNTPAGETMWHAPSRYYSFFLQCPSIAGLDVLDVACGEGRYTRQLAMRSPKRVVGLDLSSEMLKSAMDHPDQAALRVECVCHLLLLFSP